MKQEPIQAQGIARAEHPTPAGKAEQPKGRADRKKALVELTDADLQAVSGGASKPSSGGNINV